MLEVLQDIIMAAISMCRILLCTYIYIYVCMCVCSYNIICMYSHCYSHYIFQLLMQVPCLFKAGPLQILYQNTTHKLTGDMHLWTLVAKIKIKVFSCVSGRIYSITVGPGTSNTSQFYIHSPDCILYFAITHMFKELEW